MLTMVALQSSWLLFFTKQNVSAYHYTFFGAGHYDDFPKVFRNDTGYGGQLRNYWANFIVNNDPNDALTKPQWPTYDIQRNIMNFKPNGIYTSTVARVTCSNNTP